MEKTNSISVIGLKGKERTEAIKKLTDNGKKELKELTLHYQGKAYNAIILMDFQLLRKAMSALINTDVSGSKKNASVSVSIDDLGAGDKLLFNGWHEGDEEIRQKIALRAKACKELGAWLQGYMDENVSDEDEEKKS